MKILHFISSLDIGGAEMMLYKVIKHWPHAGDTHQVVTLKAAGPVASQLHELGIVVHSLDLGSVLSFPRGASASRKIIQGFVPDIIQGWMPHGNLMALIGKLWAGSRAPVLWNIRQSLAGYGDASLSSRLVNRLGALLSSWVDKIVVNSDESLRQHITYGYVDNFVMIDNGFELERFFVDKQAAIVQRHALAIPERAVVMGIVARFHPMKNFDQFMRLAERLMITDDNVYAVLIGADVEADNPFFADCLAQSKAAARYVLLGPRRDIHAIMPCFDMMISTSLWGESFPNVLGEAMACGVPCIASNVGGSAHVVGDTGFIVPPGDDDAMLAALENMIALGAEGRAELGTKARQRVEQNFDIKKIARDYVQLYQACLSNQSHQMAAVHNG